MGLPTIQLVLKVLVASLAKVILREQKTFHVEVHFKLILFFAFCTAEIAKGFFNHQESPPEAAPMLCVLYPLLSLFFGEFDIAEPDSYCYGLLSRCQMA